MLRNLKVAVVAALAGALVVVGRRARRGGRVTVVTATIPPPK